MDSTDIPALKGYRYDTVSKKAADAAAIRRK